MLVNSQASINDSSDSSGFDDSSDSNCSNPATVHVKPTKTRKRLNLDLTAEAYELLQRLANESGKNMADVLRTGLALYGIVQEENKQGRSLAIADGDKVVTKIVAV
jgi:hypothetical protein